MGRFEQGRWIADDVEDADTTTATRGAFKRRAAAFRSAIEDRPDATFAPEAGRYHLTVSYACPWAHRTLIVRALKGLDTAIGVSVVNWFLGPEGWTFDPGEGVVPEPHEGVRKVRELYQIANPDYDGRVTVPVLWDRRTRTIVNNESSEIIRFFNTSFQDLARYPAIELGVPARQQAELDAVNDRVYHTVNNGVYKAGFAGSQEAHDEAVVALFDSLEWLEQRLSGQRWLMGERFTEADVRLFTTLVRFDPVYHTHFKCNLKRLADFPHLWAYTREIAQHARVRPTIDMGHIKQHYFRSHESINPRRLVPLGPLVDLEAPHDRADLGGQPMPA